MANALINCSAESIGKIINGLCHGDNQWIASGFSIDTRKLQAGEVYIALNGKQFDGHTFVRQAMEKGAVAAIVSEIQDCVLPQILVEDTLLALQKISSENRMHSQAIMIGLTGSNGKTSTKEMLLRIFSDQGKTLATKGNLNNEIGVPLTLLNLEKEDQYAIIEMGANHLGEIRTLTKLVSPDIALITNVAEAHLEGFGSLKGVISAKSELFEYSHKKLAINADLICSKQWLNAYQARPHLSFSMFDRHADVYLINTNADHSQFTVGYLSESVDIIWQLKGKHNINNALAAISVGLLAGISLKKIAKSLCDLVLKQSRLDAIRLGNHLIYDDTYNANPASFKAAIDVIARKKHTLVIAGAMGELGATSHQLHQEVATYALQKGVEHFWALNADDYGAQQVELFDRLEILNAKLIEYLNHVDSATILIKGSRSAKMERVVDFLKNNIKD